MQLCDFDYDLPEKLIAQTPVKDRKSSRMLVLDKKTGELSHRIFSDILEYLEAGDCLVLNDTRVIPARLFGVKEKTGGKIEFVLLKRIEGDIWEVILKPGRRAKPGALFSFGGGMLKARILEIVDGGNRRVQFFYEGIFEQVLDRLGEMPLPPYIKEKLEDKTRYQTVYAKNDGSAAAPTAGLHFTEELLEEARHRGVEIAYVTLHIGLGTFRPVKVSDPLLHKMHTEAYSISQDAADLINRTKESGKRVVAVGTTSVRTLESVADENGRLSAGFGDTDIFIYPGYKFRAVDALITNFHLPQSTLIMLVSAFAGREAVLRAYAEAVKEQYRFFSFGDAMLIL